MISNKYNPLVIRGLMVILLLVVAICVYNKFEPIGYSKLVYHNSSYDNFSQILNYDIYSYSLTNYSTPHSIEELTEYIKYENSINSDNRSFITQLRRDIIKYLNLNKEKLTFNYYSFEDRDTIVYLLYKDRFVAFGYSPFPKSDSLNTFSSKIAINNCHFKDFYGNNYYSEELSVIILSEIEEINQKYLDSFHILNRADLTKYIMPAVYKYENGILSDIQNNKQIDTSLSYYKEIYNLFNKKAESRNLSQIVCSCFFIIQFETLKFAMEK